MCNSSTKTSGALGMSLEVVPQRLCFRIGSATDRREARSRTYQKAARRRCPSRICRQRIEAGGRNIMAAAAVRQRASASATS